MRKLVVTMLLLWLTGSGFAQADSATLRFHFLGVKDGLPEGSVNTLLQDRYGYIWIGTQDGLVRYDGYQPKVYSLPVRGDINANVKHIFEDRKGRLWVAPYGNSLFYYDRSRDVFVGYPLDMPKQETDDDHIIENITDNGKGSLWFVLRNLTKRHNTLLSFNPAANTFRRYSNYETGSHYLPDSNVLSITITGNGTLLAGGNSGLYRYDDAHDSFIACMAKPDSLSQNHIVLYAADKINKDEVWLAAVNKKIGGDMYDNLMRYNVTTGVLHSYHNQNDTVGSFPGNSVNDVYCAEDGSVWVAGDVGLVSFDRDNNRFTNYLPRDVKNKNSFRAEVKNIQGDGNGNLWCVTKDGLLLFHTKTKQFERYTYDPKSNNGIVDNNIRSFMVDNTGNIWFGAAQLGLQWANTSHSKFIHYQSNPGLQHYFPGSGVNEVAGSEDGTMWLSTDIGLYRWQPGTDSFTRIRLNGHDDDYYSTSVIVDDEGWVWTRATATNVGIEGLYGYDPKTKRVVNYRNREGDSTSLSCNTIRALCQDHTGAIWVGTFGSGICRLDKKTGRFTQYPFVKNTGLVVNTQAIQKGALDDDEVQSIYEDETGTLWAGTNNGGLNRLDRNINRFVPYQKPITNMHCVLSILSAGNGKLWGGTYSNDVYLVDTKHDTYTSLSEATGLLYNGGWGMQYDDAGNLWLSSPRGLSIIGKNKTIRNLTVAGGLPAEPLNFFLYKTKRRDFIYGTSDGFVLFNPADVITKPLPPPVVHIESIAFADEKNSQLHDSVLFAFGRKEIQLAYDENRITISYVGLQYQNASLTKYQYQLEGYDKSWIDGGTQRQVTYTNLSPGSYTFRVKAINSDGIESKTTGSLRVIISPPWWKTWWAYVLYVVGLALAVWSFIVYRSKQLVEQNKLLEEKVTERTQQLNQSLTELKATQAQLVQSEKMASLGELTAGIAHEIQNPLNFVNNFSEVNKELIGELQEEMNGENYEEVKLIAKDIADNEEKIAHHGKRADAIVKNMLQHSRKSNGQKELTNINALCDEYLRLSYHGMRTKDKSFNAQLQTDFDSSTGNIPVVPQDLGRVLLNLFNNAFYAVNEKKKRSEAGYQPLVGVLTKQQDDKVKIIVSDNGNGIPSSIINKIFQPFFTTKPTGEGTGLGLSLSYDIITKEHGGTVEVESKEGEGTTFIITLPSA